MNDRQSEARASIEGAAERLKDSVEILGRDPASLILNSQNDPTVAFRPEIGCDRQPETPATGHRAQPVRREVPDDLPDLVLVRLAPDRALRRLDVDYVMAAYLRAVAQQKCRVLQNFRKSRRDNADRCGLAYARNDLMVSFSRSDSRRTMSINCA